MEVMTMFNLGIIGLVEMPRYYVVSFKEGARIYWKVGKYAGRLI